VRLLSERRPVARLLLLTVCLASLAAGCPDASPDAGTPKSRLTLGASDFYSRGVKVDAEVPSQPDASRIRYDARRDSLFMWPHPRPRRTTTLRVPVEQGPQRLTAWLVQNPACEAAARTRIALEIPGRDAQVLAAPELSPGKMQRIDARYEVDGRGAELVLSVTMSGGAESYRYARIELSKLKLEIPPD